MDDDRIGLMETSVSISICGSPFVAVADSLRLDEVAKGFKYSASSDLGGYGSCGDSDDSMAISFDLPAISKLKSESAHLELEEVPEQLPEVQSLSSHHVSPEHCKTPKLPICSMWKDSAVNFKLTETP